MKEEIPGATPVALHGESDLATVLLVDDQPVIGDIVRQVLRGPPPFALVQCTDARRALALAERARPAVILQDLQLPGMDGMTLLRRYRESAATRDVPVVVLSVNANPETKSEAFRAGASDYVVKPADPVELRARVQHHARAYRDQLAREQAYRALRENQQRLIEVAAAPRRLSSVDSLTGLGNRRHLDDHLDREWKRARREQYALSLLMIDVDEFKRYNDSYGHLAGDGVLRALAGAIQRSCVRAGDFAARFGGEEFVVVLPNTPADGAVCVAERIHVAVHRLRLPHRTSPVADQVTVSIGAATTVPGRDTGPAGLLLAADTALYRAKRAGRNRTATIG